MEMKQIAKNRKDLKLKTLINLGEKTVVFMAQN